MTAAGAAYAGAMRLAGAALRLRARGDADWRQRLVLAPPPPAPAAIWLHAASVGELNSAAEIIAALSDDPGLIVTTNSLTGRDLAARRGLPAGLAPFDAPGPVGRFLAAARPRLQVTVEGEFWPVRSARLAAAGVPQALIGARISARSAARWARMPGLIGPVLARLVAISAQDAASEARLLALGARPEAILPRLDLKLLAPAAITPPAHGAARDCTFLAASTHPGEDGPVLDAYLAARSARPDLRLILAPRHPERGEAIAAMMAERGVIVARRSAGADAGAPVLLADTLGEMARWYAAAGIVLTGGSLTDRGGHTPWEPAAHGCAVLHGPHVANFRDAYARLDAAGAALATDCAGLAAALTGLAADPAAARAMGAAARGVLQAAAGDPAPLIAHLRALARGPIADDIEGKGGSAPR